MRFTGTIEAKADAKGRVFFPAMFRKVLASADEEQLVLSRDAFQPCLVLYPRSVWDEQLDSRWSEPLERASANDNARICLRCRNGNS